MSVYWNKIQLLDCVFAVISKIRNVSFINTSHFIIFAIKKIPDIF
jgi:hypothetical protein